MKLGCVHIGYWGLGLSAEEQLRARPRGGVARLRLGLGRGGLRLRRRHHPRLARPGDGPDPPRLGDLPDARPHAGDDRDDRGDAGQPLGRPDDPRARLERAAGRGGLARAAVQPAAQEDARVHRGRADGPARASASPSRATRSSCRSPTGRASRSSSRSRRCRSASRSTSPRSGRGTRRSRPRSPTATSRFLFSPEHVDQIRPLLEEGFARAGGGKGARRLRHRPERERVRLGRPRVRPRRDAAVPRPLRRRHGLAREELLQPDRVAVRVRGRRARGAGPLPRGPQGGGGGEAARRADRRSSPSAGPPDRVRERLAALDAAGVGTLIVSPMAWTFEDRLHQLRRVAELAP